MTDRHPVALIVRGLPGSGKSTWVSKLCLYRGGLRFSTDEFWGEQYLFNFDRIGEAHAWNLGRFEGAVAAGHPLVICDNVNPRWSNFEHYFRAAHKHGYKVFVVEMPLGDPEEHAKRNTHNVPLDAIKRWAHEWSSFPGAKKWDDGGREFLIGMFNLPEDFGQFKARPNDGIPCG